MPLAAPASLRLCPVNTAHGEWNSPGPNAHWQHLYSPSIPNLILGIVLRKILKMIRGQLI
jgi:hypothetical protein